LTIPSFTKAGWFKWVHSSSAFQWVPIAPTSIIAKFRLE
jgi:hypothetical protein